MKDEAFKIVEQLVQRYGDQFDSYKSADYNETLTRRDFIDPFFKALGWDVDNSQGYAEAYREVIHEDKVKVGKATKAPDYSFRLPGGKRLFFVEAKKPSIVVKDDISVAYQVRRYGWNAKLPISMVTDFEEFAVYDCTKKPDPSDKSSIARIKYITFDKYLDEFEYLWNTFSKEQVLKGSFDRYIQSDKTRKGTTTVDKEFLITLDGWRNYLATSISIKNKQLDEDEINFVVQQTIDRLIFLRIAEDRGVEPYGQLKTSVGMKGDSYQNLFFNFKKADEKYNSGLFDFKKDKISENLVIDNKIIKTIVNEMYFPSPYEFSEIPIEILGSVYEQFLGKQIKIDSAHRTKIEEKPEVRKAGGVFYTPQYVVDYIVKNTVGKLIEGKTPKQISDVKIVDPACGSGSFLIGAYQFLLDFHKNYYTENGTKTGKKDSPTTPSGNLTSSEKKRILLNNIYGVDIDVNAVEVTKLSLLLKCMEGETETTLAQQYQLWHERILPTLDNNIKSGNSLVDTDFYDERLDFGEDRKIKPFNWEIAFPQVFKEREYALSSDLQDRILKIKNQYRNNEAEANLLIEKYKKIVEEPMILYGNKGGFDIIIGNPPYFSLSTLSVELKNYFYKLYKTYERSTDIYCLFFERALKLLRPYGIINFITSNQWLQTNYGKVLRKYLTENANPELMINFGGVKVFQDATVDTSILQIRKRPFQNFLEACHFKNDFDKESPIEEYFEKNKIILTNLENERWTIAPEINLSLKEKIKMKGKLLKYWNLRIYRGVLTGLNEAFIVDSATKNKLISEDKNAVKIIKPILRGRDVHKYDKKWTDLWLIATLPSMHINIEAYPSIKSYLLDFGREKLEQNGLPGSRKKTNNKWYETQDTIAYFENFQKAKIIYPETTVRRSEFYLDTDGFYIDKTCFMIVGEHLHYLNGILASNLMEWYFESELRLLGKNTIQYSKQFIQQIPVIEINVQNKNSAYEISNYAQLLTSLNKELRDAKLPYKVEQLKMQIDHVEDKLNEKVFELYGLDDSEIQIIKNDMKLP